MLVVPVIFVPFNKQFVKVTNVFVVSPNNCPPSPIIPPTFSFPVIVVVYVVVGTDYVSIVDSDIFDFSTLFSLSSEFSVPFSSPFSLFITIGSLTYKVFKLEFIS